MVKGISSVILPGMCHSLTVVRPSYKLDCFCHKERCGYEIIYDDICGRYIPLPRQINWYGDKRSKFGYTSKEVWRVLLPPSFDICDSDFVRVPWGMPPNRKGIGPVRLKFTISDPDGVEHTLCWNDELGIYTNDDGSILILFNNELNIWQFVDTNTGITFDLSDAGFHLYLDCLNWNLVEGYDLVDLQGEYLNFRVLEVRHRDFCCKPHHTRINIELEDEDC
jgi:hypothetical protein